MSWRDRIAKAVLGGKVGGPHEGGIYTYHSSPYDFERFDLSKLRSGEGGNMYGAGFYSAEHPKVSGQGGQYWKNFLDHEMFPREERSAAELLKAYNFNREKAIEDTQKNIASWTQYTAPEHMAELRNKIPALKRAQEQLVWLQGDAPLGPRTYELNLRVKPDELLDWDKTFAQQSPYVQDATRDIVQGRLDTAADARAKRIRQGHVYTDTLPEIGDVSGKRMYEYAGLPARNQNEGYARSTDVLRDRGVPGIRYFDERSRLYGDAAAMVQKQGGSREAVRDLADLRYRQASTSADRAYWAGIQKEVEKPVTSNYVMFDPNRIDIMAKYGVAGGVPLGATFAGSDRAQAARPGSFDDRWRGLGATYAQDQYGAQQ